MADQIESNSFEAKLAVAKPLSIGSTGDTLRFSVLWLRGDIGKILLEETGWRIAHGRIMAPATKYKSGYTTIIFPSKEVESALESLVQDWKSEFPGVEFPTPKGMAQDEAETR